MSNTTIEWSEKVWNPIRGCVETSPGCAKCYAKTFAERFRGVAGHPYEQGFDPRLVPEKLGEPLRWRAPRTVFVNSMSDLFGDFVPNDYLAAIFGVMASCPRHTFQVLTKRAERMVEWFAWVDKREADGRSMFPDDAPSWRIGQLLALCASRLGDVQGYRKGTKATAWQDFDQRRQPWPLPNVHMGVSVENRKHGLPRIDALRKVPAVVRWLSVEPLLEDLGVIDLTGIGWVVVGGESGPGSRTCDLAWVRSVVAQCKDAHVPVFVKQLGASPLGRDGEPYHFISRKGGDPAEWPEDLRVREFPR